MGDGGAQTAAPRSIFVQVPAYRDRELPKTLLSLYRRAREPEALRVVVLWQASPEERLPDHVRSLPRLTVIRHPYTESRGPNWARARIQDHLADEPYTLYLDSHHRFVPGWDGQARAMLEHLEARGVSKPVLTAYLPGYVPGRGSRGRLREPYKIYPMQRAGGLLTRLTSYPIPDWRRLTAPVTAEFLSLHFVFARSAFTREVPTDPGVYFFGDEVALGLRAYTHGWDLFHPHRVLGWHAYDRASRQPHWDHHSDWAVRNEASIRRLRQLYTAAPEMAHLLGRERSVGDYERHIMHRLVVDG